MDATFWSKRKAKSFWIISDRMFTQEVCYEPNYNQQKKLIWEKIIHRNFKMIH